MDASSDGRTGPNIRLLQAMYNATDAAVMAVDDAGVVIAFNAGAEQLFERAASDVVGEQASILFADGSDSAIQAATWTRTPGRHSAIIRHGDRAGGYVLASVSQTDVGTGDLFVITVRTTTSDRLAPAAPPDALFRSVADAMPDGVAIVQNGKRIYVNDAYVNLFDYRSREEALAAPSHERWLAEDAAERDAGPSRQGPLLPHRIVRPNGEVRLVEGARSEITFEGQSAAAVVLRDVTDREGALRGSAAEEARLWPVFEHLPLGVAIVGRDQTIIEANPALAAMVKSTPTELRGTMFAKPFPTTSQTVGRTGRWEKLVAGELDFLASERKVVDPSLDMQWVKVSVFAVRDDQDEFLYSIHTVEDITLRKSAESQREASDALWWQTFAQANVGIALVSADRNIVEANPAMAAMVGLEPSDLRGTWFGRFFPPPRLGAMGNTWDQLVSGEISSFENERPVIADGATVEWVTISSSAVRDESGVFRYGVRMVQDITERKRAEQELQSSETQFRSLYEQAPFAIAMMDSEDGFFAGNAAWETMFGYSIEEMKGYRSTDFLSPHHARLGQGNLDKMLAGEIPFVESEWLYQRKDGTDVWAAGRVSGVSDGEGGIGYVLFMLQDTTERKRAEQELQENEARLRAVFESGPFGLAIIDDEARVLDVNGWLPSMLGCAREEIIGRRMEEFVDPTYVRRRRRAAQRLVTGEDDRWTSDRRYLRKDGTTFPASVSTSVVRDEQGQFLYAIRAIQDITERVEAAASLAESEARFRAVFENAPLPMLLIDGETKVLNVNREAQLLFGYDVLEMSGRPMREFSDAGEVRLDGMRESEMLIMGEADAVSSERIYRRKDGSTFPAQVSTAAVRDSTGTYRYSIRAIQDLTATREVERGKDEFIAMTSHELRTPVTAMHAAVTLVASGVFGTMPERAQSMLDIAASNSDRLVALVNDLIDLERMNLGKVEISPEQINAGDIARQAVDLVRPLAAEAGVSVTAEPEDVTVVADPGRILQTLQNLLSNAIKFSPAGSAVVLRVSHDDTRIAFRVEDQGKGIPDEHLESIFERFQQVDSSDVRGAGGTGLGLAIAKAIVERHRGRIWVESELGVGSTFIVELPTGQTWTPLVIDK